MIKHVHITVSGRVQGVFFRAYTEKKANELVIHGTVRNQKDGTVFIDAQADEGKIDRFIDWCWQGSPLSSVTDVSVLEVDALLSVEGFSITR